DVAMTVEHDESVVVLERAPRPCRRPGHRNVERRFLRVLDGSRGRNLRNKFGCHVTSAPPGPEINADSIFSLTSGRVFRQAAHFLGHQLAVRTLALHQAVRRAVLEDLTAFEDHDPIEIAQSGKTMSNRNNGPPAHEPAERLAYRFLGFAIERGS